MRYILYTCLTLMITLSAKVGSAHDRVVTKPEECYRCQKDNCQRSAALAESCIKECTKSESYLKIANDCATEGGFKAALAKKTQGPRLAEIQIQEAKDLDKHDGIEGSELTPKGIFMLLQDLKLIKPGKNPEDAESALKIDTVPAGLYSTKIYIVTILGGVDGGYQHTPDTVFVIKGLRNAEKVVGSEENTPQKELQGLEKVQQFITPLLKDTGVQIATTKGAFWYYTQSQFMGDVGGLKKNYVVVLGLAAGKSVSALGKIYSQSQNNQALAKLMRKVGEGIGKVHYALATPEAKSSFSKGEVNLATLNTTIHEDLHEGNVFYDPETEQVTLIDTASMANTLTNKVSPEKDIGDFCSGTKQFNEGTVGEKSFISGYVSAFPKPSQERLKAMVSEMCKKAQP